MRIYRPVWSESLVNPFTRLKIGSCCSLCFGHSPPSIDICDACESLLHRLVHTNRAGLKTQVCLQCGVETPVKQPQQDSAPRAAQSPGYRSLPGTGSCSACMDRWPLFERIVAPYRYHFPLDRLIHDLKYRNQRSLARVFGALLARSVRLQGDEVPMPDYLIPVPLHPKRRASRGYNQAHQIARWCACDLRLRCRPGAAHRIVDTESLAGLSRSERQYRILGAFRATSVVAGKRVAIVDDVLTTGATAGELARELYDTGAESVELWVLARTSSDR